MTNEIHVLHEHERLVLAAINVANSPNNDVDADVTLGELFVGIGSLSRNDLVASLGLLAAIRRLPQEEWWRLGIGQSEGESLGAVQERLQATSFGVEDVVLGALGLIIAGEKGAQIAETYAVHAVHQSNPYPDKEIRDQLDGLIRTAEEQELAVYGLAWWQRVNVECCQEAR